MLKSFTLKQFQKAALTSLTLLAAAGCGEQAADEQPVLEEPSSQEVWDAEQEARGDTQDGAFLYGRETFAGNGRTCATCHSSTTGTLSPAQAQASFLRDPTAPLFRSIDSDDGVGNSYSKLLNDATILVDIPLPPNVKLASDPTATVVKMRRGIPSTFDSPALDPVVMMDGREGSLTSQAHSAIMGHAQATRAPTGQQLASIASFEQGLFSSRAMRDYARTGVAPALPSGTTASEKRGRAFFEPTGLCGSCHSGALLNETTGANPLGLPEGSRFGSSAVSEFNTAGNPVHEFIITLADGTQQRRFSPDPGRFLITGRLEDFNFFKMTSLRNLRNTAPYFHDNSAKTLEDVVTQYTVLFELDAGIIITPQEQADIVAYMKVL